MRSTQAAASEERGVKEITFAMDASLDCTGDERFFSLRDFSFAEGGDNEVNNRYCDSNERFERDASI
jgi:hypothetical protein